MASPIEDVSSLPGQTVSDQEGEEVGEIQEIYAAGGDDDDDGEGEAMYVTIEMSTGMNDSRIVFVPLARLKCEKEQYVVPYSRDHLQESPEIDAEDELSHEDDRTLRDYYAIDHTDQELRADNDKYDSFARVVPEAVGAKKVDDAENSDLGLRTETETDIQAADERDHEEKHDASGEADSDSEDEEEEGSDSDSEDDEDEAKAQSEEDSDEESESKGDSEEESKSEEDADSQPESKADSDSESKDRDESESKSESKAEA